MIPDLIKYLATGLVRSSSTTCSRWAQNYVHLGKPIPGPLRFTRFPWSKEMLDCDQNWVGMKGAQMSFTLNALVRSFFQMDVRKNNVSYFLPKWKPDAHDFSKHKFDTILDHSPHIEEMFSEVRNVGHKRAGGVDFFLRGTQSTSGMKGISTGVIIFDEYDEMPAFATPLGQERASAFLEEDKQTIWLSTPTIPNYGIHTEYKGSDQSHFMFKCPSCGRMTELTFPECLVITAETYSDPNVLNSHLICSLCKNKLPHESKVEWLKDAYWVKNANSHIRGFAISQMYSTIRPPSDIAIAALKAAAGDEFAEQELYNSKLGIPFTREGTNVSDAEVTECLGPHSINSPPPSGIVTMGVDVGHKLLFYWIDFWLLPVNPGPDLNAEAKVRTITMGTLHDFYELDKLMSDYQVISAIVDVDPSFRDAYSFCSRFQGYAHLCRFTRGIQKTHINFKSEDLTVMVNRTSWLDLSQSRFRRKTILLPHDTLTEAKMHITAPRRTPKRDKDGNPVTQYISDKPDHFAFARVYSEIALPFAVSSTQNVDINSYTS